MIVVSGAVVVELVFVSLDPGRFIFTLSIRLSPIVLLHTWQIVSDTHGPKQTDCRDAFLDVVDMGANVYWCHGSQDGLRLSAPQR